MAGAKPIPVVEQPDYAYTNILREMAHGREYPEINHQHSTLVSDGENPVSDHVEAAAQRGVTRLGFSDHGDVTGISGREKGYYGEEEFRDPESLKMAVENYIDEEGQEDLPLSESFDVQLAVGMEINYDHRHREEIKDYIKQHPLDYVIISVHHDLEGRNITNRSAYSLSDDLDQVLNNYYNTLIPGAAELANEMDEIVTLAHWDRPERNPVFKSRVKPEHYVDAHRKVEGYDVLTEFNAKTYMRNILLEGQPTLGSQFLINNDVQMSGGTDTHRIGNSSKVNYGVNETEIRHMELERIAEQTGRMETVLEDLNLDSVRVRVTDDMVRESFKNGDKYSPPNIA